jgi:hypothetical protein
LVREGRPRIAWSFLVGIFRTKYEVGDHEVYEFCAKVVWRSKLDGQRYLAKGY